MALPGSEALPPAASARNRERAAVEPPRGLACILCHQRKLKCDRALPCANCVKAAAQCVPGSAIARPRRRRFPERELLERLRHYESLLRRNDIAFDPLHPHGAHPSAPGRDHGRLPSPARALRLEPRLLEGKDSPPPPPPPPSYDGLNLWRAVNHQSDRDSIDGGDVLDESDSSSAPFMSENSIQTAVDCVRRDDNDFLLLLAPSAGVDPSALHPRHVHIFKLWQVYLDNVNPLLKLTHTPTLQMDIVNAAADIGSTSPPFQALMFGIYCTSVLSLEDGDCLTMFGSTRADLLFRYQVGCRQALVRCGFLRSDDRHCLIALYLYLHSIKPDVDRRSLSSMFGTAVRIAQRIGLHSESRNAECSPFEAEMRRRLWWSLVIFDARICETANNLQSTILIPTWDCKPPSNLNDFDLRPEMKTLPPVHQTPTEALYAVARGHVAQFLRHRAFHLDFINPLLSFLVRNAREESRPNTSSGTRNDNEAHDNEAQMAAFEKKIDDRYIAQCNPDVPLHFLTIWTLRSQLAKIRLLKHYWTTSRSSSSSSSPEKPGRQQQQQTDAHRDAAVSHALTIVECESHLFLSPQAKPFRWHLTHFPFPAYVHLIHDLRRRPLQPHAERAWASMSADFAARFPPALAVHTNPVFALFAKALLQAWTARELALAPFHAPPPQPPPIVLEMKRSASSPPPPPPPPPPHLLPPDLAQDPHQPPPPPPPFFHQPPDLDLDDLLPVPIGLSHALTGEMLDVVGAAGGAEWLDFTAWPDFDAGEGI